MAWTTPSTAVAGSTALTAAFWNEQVRDNTNALYDSVRRLAFTNSRTTDYTVDTDALASAAEFFASDLTFTAAGSTIYRVEFYCPIVYSPTTANATTTVHLADGAGTELAKLARVGLGDGTREAQAPVYGVHYYTPSAGSTTLNIRATRSAGAGNGQMIANASAGFYAWLAVYGPALT